MRKLTSPDQIKLCGQVGRGGFGVVYRGIIVESDMVVAVKEIDLDQELADLYEVTREIEILSECHLAQITAYLGCIVNGPRLWVVMEYIDGGLLYELLQQGNIADENLVAYIAREILLALKYLHDEGKIHRDLKSHNVLLTLDGRVKLTDFGVSTQLFSSFSRRNTIVGTPYWMAPEIIVNSSGGHNHHADVWSLGCCIYEMSTGKPLLQDRFSPMQALRAISSYETDSDFWSYVDEELLSGFSPPLYDILQRCMVIDPNKRPSAAALLNFEFIQNVDVDAGVRSLKAMVARRNQSQENPFIEPLPQSTGHRDTLSIHFEFSTIKAENREFSPLTPPSLRLVLDQSRAPAHTTKGYTWQKIQLMKSGFEKIAAKSLLKMNQRMKLLASQYNQLTALNTDMLLAFMLVEFADKTQSKILLCQHLKNILKEMSRLPPDQTKSHLSRALMPSSFTTNIQEARPNRSKIETPMDEVERSLFASWIETMKPLVRE